MQFHVALILLICFVSGIVSDILEAPLHTDGTSGAQGDGAGTPEQSQLNYEDFDSWKSFAGALRDQYASNYRGKKQTSGSGDTPIEGAGNGQGENSGQPELNYNDYDSWKAYAGALRNQYASNGAPTGGAGNGQEENSGQPELNYNDYDSWKAYAGALRNQYASNRGYYRGKKQSSDSVEAPTGGAGNGQGENSGQPELNYNDYDSWKDYAGALRDQYASNKGYYRGRK